MSSSDSPLLPKISPPPSSVLPYFLFGTATALGATHAGYHASKKESWTSWVPSLLLTLTGFAGVLFTRKWVKWSHQHKQETQKANSVSAQVLRPQAISADAFELLSRLEKQVAALFPEEEAEETNVSLVQGITIDEGDEEEVSTDEQSFEDRLQALVDDLDRLKIVLEENAETIEQLQGTVNLFRKALISRTGVEQGQEQAPTVDGSDDLLKKVQAMQASIDKLNTPGSSRTSSVNVSRYTSPEKEEDGSKRVTFASPVEKKKFQKVAEELKQQT